MVWDIDFGKFRQGDCRHGATCRVIRPPISSHASAKSGRRQRWQRDLYGSEWFLRVRGFVESKGALGSSFPAKYGLVEPVTGFSNIGSSSYGGSGSCDGNERMTAQTIMVRSLR